jgi:hypothetical protein
MSAHMEKIDALADRILAMPARTWGDVMLYAQVLFWKNWPGIDPEGADALPQMRAGPMSQGEEIDRALARLLEAIFVLGAARARVPAAIFAESRPASPRQDEIAAIIGPPKINETRRVEMSEASGRAKGLYVIRHPNTKQITGVWTMDAGQGFEVPLDRYISQQHQPPYEQLPDENVYKAQHPYP